MNKLTRRFCRSHLLLSLLWISCRADQLEPPSSNSTSMPSQSTAPSPAPSLAPSPLDSAMPSDFPSLVPSEMPSSAPLNTTQPPIGVAAEPTPAPTNATTAATTPPTGIPTTQSTTLAPAPEFLCDLCPGEMEITLPDATFTNPFTGDETTCAEEQALGQSGAYSMMQCMTLQNEVSNVCGCEMVVLTSAPTPSPTLAPNVPATRAPISSPPQPFRANPTSAPTGTRYESTGQVYIELQFVADTMPAPFQDDFNAQITEFFTRTLARLPSPIFNVEARLLEQELGEIDSNNLRGTDEDGRPLPPLLTLVNVKGDTESQSVVEEMNWILYYAVINDPSGLSRLLRQAESNGANLYFRLVETVDAFNVDSYEPPTTDISPTPAPDSGDSGLSGGAIGGIVAAVAVLVIVVSAAVVMTKKEAFEEVPTTGHTKANSKPATRQEIPEDDESDESSVPPPRKQPEPEPVITAAVSLATDEQKQQQQQQQQQQHEGSISQQEGSVMSQSDYGGDNMSYAYSLDPGNVDNQTAPSVPLGTGESTLDDQTTEFSARPNMVSRQVAAPPGKLGIVIDTTLEGPVIHKVNPGSPLEGSVYPGDIIVAIDNVDTRAMSASAITALMVKTANQERRLTVLSEEEPEE